MISNQYNKVKEFHTVFGHPVAVEKQHSLFNENKKLLSFRMSLIIEEINELKDAYNANDLVEFVDALADILYVVYGAGLVFGVQFQNAYDVNSVVTNTNNNILSERNDSLYNSLFDSSNGLFEAIKVLNSESITTLDLFEDVCCRIIKLVYMLSECVRVNIDDCFSEVHRSNMTKVCSTEEDAKLTVEWYKDNDIRYSNPQYRYSNGYYIIYDAVTTKILKSRKYEEAQPGLGNILLGKTN